MPQDSCQIDSDPESEIMTLGTLPKPGTRCSDE